MPLPLSIRLGPDSYGYGPIGVPPAEYYDNRRSRPLRAAKYYGPSFIPSRHTWADFHVDYFREHLGPRLLQLPCPDPPMVPFPRSPRSVHDVKQAVPTLIFEPVNLALRAVFLPPFVPLLYSLTFRDESYKSLEIYRIIRPTQVMWDDLYQVLPDDCAVPRWNQLSVEEKGRALIDMLPLISHCMPEGVNAENHEWDQPTPSNLEKSTTSTQADYRVPGALRYLAYVERRTAALLRMAEQAVEEKDHELIACLIRNIIPSDEIIPYLAPYMSADNVVRTTQELKDAFSKGQLRQTLSALEPRWNKFCQVETDAEALTQIFVQLPPAFPELLPEHSELRSVNYDRVVVVSGYRAGFVPGFPPDAACISAQSLKLDARERINRVPGEIGFSWDINMLSDLDLETSFALSALAKAYTYSNQHNTRYGYLLTDESLLIFRRCEKEPGIPRNGHIQMSKVFWVGYNANLALFYLHLLASHPTNWKLPSTLWNGSYRLFDLHNDRSFNDHLY